jgi:predicted RNA binding protein YcfA (HicA-like mRNA interferase family)
MNQKHMVYAEDILYAIMQHPSKNITKGLVKQIVEQVVAEKEVTIGMCMPVAQCGDLAKE